MSFIHRYAAELAEEYPNDLIVPIVSPKLASTVLGATTKAYPDCDLVVDLQGSVTDTYLVPIVVQVLFEMKMIVLHVANPTIAGGE